MSMVRATPVPMPELRLRGISRVLMTLDPVSSSRQAPATDPSHANSCIWPAPSRSRDCSAMQTMTALPGRWSPGVGRVEPGRWAGGARALGQVEPELALAGPPHLVADQQAQLRPVLPQPLRVDEAGQVVPPALADHDAVQQQPGPLFRDIDLAQLVPGRVPRQHDHALQGPWRCVE